MNDWITLAWSKVVYKKKKTGVRILPGSQLNIVIAIFVLNMYLCWFVYYRLNICLLLWKRVLKLSTTISGGIINHLHSLPLIIQLEVIANPYFPYVIVDTAFLFPWFTRFCFFLSFCGHCHAFFIFLLPQNKCWMISEIYCKRGTMPM